MSTVYTPNFFEALTQRSSAAARVILPLVLEKYLVHKLLDVGCGTGGWLREAEALGIEIQGIDAAWVPPEQMVVSRDRVRFADLSIANKLPFASQSFDMVVCLEVIEHLPANRAAWLAEELVRCAPVVMFSGATPGQGGYGHVNERPFSYWASLFTNKGYVLDDCVRPSIAQRESIPSWYRKNIVVFRKGFAVAYDDKEAWEIAKRVDGWFSEIEGKVLYSLVGRAPAGEMVEIGSWKGRSSIMLAAAAACKNRRVHCIDTFQGARVHQERAGGKPLNMLPDFTQNLRAAGLQDAVIVHAKSSREARLSWGKKPISLLFVDGEHDLDGVSDDIDSWSPLVVKGGLLAMHDVGYLPGPTQVHKRLAASPAWTHVSKDGLLAVLRRN